MLVPRLRPSSDSAHYPVQLNKLPDGDNKFMAYVKHQAEWELTLLTHADDNMLGIIDESTGPA